MKDFQCLVYFLPLGRSIFKSYHIQIAKNLHKTEMAFAVYLGMMWIEWQIGSCELVQQQGLLTKTAVAEGQPLSSKEHNWALNMVFSSSRRLPALGSKSKSIRALPILASTIHSYWKYTYYRWQYAFPACSPFVSSTILGLHNVFYLLTWNNEQHCLKETHSTVKEVWQ